MDYQVRWDDRDQKDHEVVTVLLVMQATMVIQDSMVWEA
jgi:hypothetical protein